MKNMGFRWFGKKDDPITLENIFQIIVFHTNIIEKEWNVR